MVRLWLCSVRDGLCSVRVRSEFVVVPRDESSC